MEETLLKIEDAIAGESNDSVAEWLERIRHELFLANAINLLHLCNTHDIDETNIDERLKAAAGIMSNH